MYPFIYSFVSMPFTRRYARKKYRKKAPRKGKKKGKMTRYRKVRYPNQTLQFTFENSGSARQYTGNSGFKTSKQNVMTSYFHIGTSIATNHSLKDIVRNSSGFFNCLSNFKQIRFKWIKLKLIPEKWNAATLISSATLADGEKPELHWINDDGTFYRENANATDPQLVGIDTARENVKRKYKTRQFTKDMTFFIKPYSKNDYQSDKKYTTCSSWQETLGDQAVAVFKIPKSNFYYGVSGAASDPLVNDNFKWQEHLSFCCEFKDPNFS